MSVKVMGRVWDYVLAPTEQSVLLALADHAEHDGSSVFPSIARVAWKTGLSERSVQRVVRGLRGRGVLVVVREANFHRPTEYRIDFDPLVRKEPFRPPPEVAPIELTWQPEGRGVTLAPLAEGVTRAQGVTPVTPRGDTESRGVTLATGRGDTTVSPKSSSTRPSEPSVSRQRTTDDLKDDEEVLTDPVIESTLRLLQSLDGYDFDVRVDRRSLRAFRTARPGVDLVSEVQAWIARGREGKGLRDQRAALMAWLRKAANSRVYEDKKMWERRAAEERAASERREVGRERCECGHMRSWHLAPNDGCGTECTCTGFRGTASTEITREMRMRLAGAMIGA